jgi:hypothetical protein
MTSGHHVRFRRSSFGGFPSTTFRSSRTPKCRSDERLPRHFERKSLQEIFMLRVQKLLELQEILPSLSMAREVLIWKTDRNFSRGAKIAGLPRSQIATRSMVTLHCGDEKCSNVNFPERSHN